MQQSVMLHPQVPEPCRRGTSDLSGCFHRFLHTQSTTVHDCWTSHASLTACTTERLIEVQDNSPLWSRLQALPALWHCARQDGGPGSTPVTAHIFFDSPGPLRQGWLHSWLSPWMAEHRSRSPALALRAVRWCKNVAAVKPWAKVAQALTCGVVLGCCSSSLPPSPVALLSLP